MSASTAVVAVTPAVAPTGLPSVYSFKLTGIDTATKMEFTTANWVFPAISGFSHDSFWKEVTDKHSLKTMNEAIELILDLARFHFSPKVKGLPGVDVTMTIGGDVTNFSLDKGKTKAKPFSRGKGSTYSYTACCLATATVFEQAFHSNPSGKAACMSIPGQVDGYSQMCGTLDGWTQADQDAAQVAFTNWITSIGATARDADATKKIHSAAAKTISNRIAAGPAAYSVKNILLVLTGGAVIKDPITKEGSASNTP